jgi:hypothetical protein
LGATGTDVPLVLELELVVVDFDVVVVPLPVVDVVFVVIDVVEVVVVPLALVVPEWPNGLRADPRSAPADGEVDVCTTGPAGAAGACGCTIVLGETTGLELSDTSTGMAMRARTRATATGHSRLSRRSTRMLRKMVMVSVM